VVKKGGIVYINKKAVKDKVHRMGFRISSSGLCALNERIDYLIEVAGKNAGGKKTIIREDVILTK